MSIDIDDVAIKELSAQLTNPALFELTFTEIHADGVDIAFENPENLFTSSDLQYEGVTYELTVPLQKKQ